jgi:putative redox protein
MHIQLELKSDAPYHFEAVNESGAKISIDASPSIGGQNLGPRPMELLIMGLGGCSGIDILSILRKQRIEPSSFHVSIQAEREANVEPSLFKKIHATYTFGGSLDAAKCERAIQLSLEKYCSVAKTLEATAEITYSFEIKEA